MIRLKYFILPSDFTEENYLDEYYSAHVGHHEWWEDGTEHVKTYKLINDTLTLVK